MKHYLGLDVSLKETAICVVDEGGDILSEGKALSEPEAIAAWLAQLDLPIAKVGLEIGGLARWLYGELARRDCRRFDRPPAPAWAHQGDAGQDRWGGWPPSASSCQGDGCRAVTRRPSNAD